MPTQLTAEINQSSTFLQDVLAGLTSSPKKLQSKYFYDAAGDILFQEIMNCPEYYLTNCEMEIFSEQTAGLAEVVLNGFREFDLIELGAGDATKSTHLLRHLLEIKADFTYLPIDISSHVIEELEQTLPAKLPGLKLQGLNGDYFDMLKEARVMSDRPKVVLLMGSNIGNMPVKEAYMFCAALRQQLSPGDLALIGFDLKKNPKTILAAYDDAAGITKNFNLNLLKRINNELNVNFKLNQFDHYATYDPESGSCKSYLISLVKQEVQIGESELIQFEENEFIDMEISQKYTLQQTDDMALNAGFEPVKHFFDSKNWFVDVVWKAV
ncbi:L-histidine N(alpha)-methyltransferase [Mucilaginibacter arboris]|uniref:L-histidine N(Alpha)-methyltransferase n=1 Tax=Mucilaginibacter arboris TaxID=2682090 RepID=A0A7K1SZQ9_9SPHI|nr:L-histidine N(alpha)-methyltransferase [Mucilaginibacter arboris]MVN22799.1 L-histidine N(alpha)-methyltransferase [Mucilaginibacter arboris]